MRIRLTRYALLLLLALGTGACAGEAEPPSADGPAAQPAEDAPVLVSGDFGEVPIHPLAEEAGSKTYEADVVAQSFSIRNMSREALFSWYSERLDGWTVEEAPHALGEAADASWRALWTRGDRRLIVTVSQPPPSAGEGTGPDVVLQYSLSLEPIGRPVPDPGPQNGSN